MFTFSDNSSKSFSAQTPTICEATILHTYLKDKNGNQFKTKKGCPFFNLEVCVTNEQGESANIYHAIFNKKQLNSVVTVINYNLPVTDNFDETELHGKTCLCEVVNQFYTNRFGVRTEKLAITKWFPLFKYQNKNQDLPF